MRIIQTLSLLFLAYFLLIYLWPVLLILVGVIAYQIFKARRMFRQNMQEEEPNTQNKTYETFRQDNTDEVIDANYTERSQSDGPK